MTDFRRRILIFTIDTGFGHRSAANAISIALAELFGEQCQVEIVNPAGDKRAPAILRETQSDYDRMVRQWPQAYKLGFKLSNDPIPMAVVERALTVMLYTLISDTLRSYRPDALIVTMPIYLAPLSAVMNMQGWEFPVLTVITDLTNVHRQWFSDGSDLLMVPTQEVYDQAMKFGFAPERVKITGIPVNPRFSQQSTDRQMLRGSLGWRQDITTVLIVGSKRVKNLTGVIHLLNHSGLAIQLAIVAGGDVDLYSWLERQAWHLPVHYYNYVQNMPDLMLASDCLMSKAGGLIVSESLACGLPLLLIDVTPGQEEGNAKYVIERGAGELASEPEMAQEVLCHWLLDDCHLLRERAQKAGTLGRPRAAYEIAEICWQAIGEEWGHPRGLTAQARRKLRELLRNFGIQTESDLRGESIPDRGKSGLR